MVTMILLPAINMQHATATAGQKQRKVEQAKAKAKKTTENQGVCKQGGGGDQVSALMPSTASRWMLVLCQKAGAKDERKWTGSGLDDLCKSTPP